MLVYHPREWARNWPEHERAYATRQLCRLAHPEVPDEEIIESRFMGPTNEVVMDESELAVSALVPTEPVEAPVSVPNPSPTKSKSKKSK